MQSDLLQKLKEERQKDREKLHGKSASQKIGYYFMYYKIPFFIALFVAIIIICVCHARMNRRDIAFHAYFINAQTTESDDTFEDDLSALWQIDTNSEQVLIDSSLLFGGYSTGTIGSTEKFASEINTATLDACVMPEEYFLSYAAEGAFGDLSEYLSEDLLLSLADDLVYEDETPVGIRVQSFSAVTTAGLYAEEDSPVLGVIYNTPHPDKIPDFVEYLMQSE